MQQVTGWHLLYQLWSPSYPPPIHPFFTDIPVLVLILSTVMREEADYVGGDRPSVPSLESDRKWMTECRLAFHRGTALSPRPLSFPLSLLSFRSLPTSDLGNIFSKKDNFWLHEPARSCHKPCHCLSHLSVPYASDPGLQPWWEKAQTTDPARPSPGEELALGRR